MEQKEETKVFIREDGIIYVEIDEKVSEEGIRDLINRMVEALGGVPKKPKILVNLGSLFLIRSSSFRKEISDKIKIIFKKHEFGKTAFYSVNVKTRTVVSFIIAGTGFKNMRIFKSEQEALKWLKTS